jgi:alkylated DNA repair dioxygenase AlkB
MFQASLFETQILPEGMLLSPDAISPEEELDLVLVCRSLPFREFRMHGVAAKRRIADIPVSALPAPIQKLRERAAALAGIEASALEHVLVTEYLPGAGIGWHRDQPQFGIVAGISLLAECRMRFKKGTGADRRVLALDLQPRSMYVLSGSARTEWQHSITPLKALRYSVTLRTPRTPSANSRD